MKYIAVLLLVFSAIQTLHAQEIERMTDDLIPFAYESRAQIPTAEENLASLISIEYRRARDEFTKHELMEKILPVIKEKLKDAKNNNKYLLRVGSRLGEYDFKNKYFPSGFSETTFIPFDHGYAITFDNAKKMENIPLSLEQAKSLSKSLQKSRRITALIYIEIKSTKEESLNWNHHKSLVAHITKVEYLTNDGHAITTINL